MFFLVLIVNWQDSRLSQDQRLPGKDVRVLEVKLSADISPKVNSYFLHPRDKLKTMQIPMDLLMETVMKSADSTCKASANTV